MSSSERSKKYDIVLPVIDISNPSGQAKAQAPAPQFVDMDPMAELEKYRKEEERELIKDFRMAKLIKAANDARAAAGLPPVRVTLPESPQGPVYGGGGQGDAQQPTQEDDRVRSLEIPAKLLEELPNMDEEKRNGVINALERIAAIRAISSDRKAALTYGLSGYVADRPSATAPDIRGYMDTLLKAVTAGKEMAAQATVAAQNAVPPAHPDSGLDRQLLNKLIDRALAPPPPSAPAPNSVEDALKVFKAFRTFDDEFSSRAPTVAPTSDSVAIQLEQIRTDKDIRLAELGLKKQENDQKAELEDAKMGLLKEGITTATNTLGAAIAGGEVEALMQGGAAPPPPSPAAMSHRTVDITCPNPNCSKTFPVIDPQVGQKMPCPNCKEMLEFKA